MSTGLIWAVNAEGGYAYSDNLSRYLRTAMQPGSKFRQLCDAKDATQQGLGKGDMFHWNVYGDLGDDGDIAKNGLDENKVMPEDDFTITQGTLYMNEFGRAVPYSGKLDDLSEHPIKEIINKTLRNHAVKTLDKAAHDQFNACATRVAAATSTTAVVLTANGATVTTNNVALGTGHVKAIVDTMKERDVPAYAHGDYYSVTRPTVLRTFKNSLETIHQYTDTGLAKIMNGEVGRYENTRFIEQTNIDPDDAGTAGVAWTNSKSGWAYFMGEDTVAEAIAIPEEMRGKLPTDFGRSKAIAWYALLGFGLIHTTSNADQSRIFMWDSAT